MLRKNIFLTFSILLIQATTASEKSMPDNTKIAAIAQKSQNNLTQGISSLFQLMLATTTPRLNEIISKQDAQKGIHILEELKKLNWEKIYQAHAGSMQQPFQKSDFNALQKISQQRMQALQNLDESYPQITQLKEILLAPNHLAVDKLKNITDKTLEINKSDLMAYIEKKEKIYTQYENQQAHLTKQKKETKTGTHKEYDKFLHLREQMFSLMEKYQDKFPTKEKKGHRNFWINFFEQLMQQLAPAIVEALEQEFKIASKTKT